MKNLFPNRTNTANLLRRHREHWKHGQKLLLSTPVRNSGPGNYSIIVVLRYDGQFCPPFAPTISPPTFPSPPPPAVKVKAAFCSNLFLGQIRKAAARLLRQPILHLLYDISCVRRACVRVKFSAICRLLPCLWDMGIEAKTGRNATTRPVHLNGASTPAKAVKVRRWNGAVFS